MNSQHNGSNPFRGPAFLQSYSEGAAAFHAGLTKEACLYQPATIQFIGWHRGFDEAHEMLHDLDDEVLLGDRLLVAILILIVLAGAILYLFTR